MEQQTTNNTNGQLGLQAKNEFLAILDSLFPEQDLFNENSKFRKKADFTFELIQQQNWTAEEFKKTLMTFSEKWGYSNWMPANILDFKKRLFFENEMVM